MRFSTFAVRALALLAVVGNDFYRGRGSHLLAAAEEEAAAASDAAGAGFAPPADAEKYPFEAEVHRMLDIVVNSLYQNKDVFLRELISNASDALDKIRYLLLTEPDKYKSSEDDADEAELQVQIFVDEDAQTLTIRDTGIGMTHDDMVKNLGTVARSGTTKFLEALKESDNTDATISQIGQFGVGFYSTFLVSDRVTVASKNPLDPVQHVWESENGSGDFVVYPDPRGNTLQRGTEITLHLKEDCIDYADEDRLTELAKHYSEFVTHKISLRKTETIEVEDEDEEDEDEEEKDDEEKDDLEVSDEDDVDEDDEEKEKKKKMKKVTTHSWEVLNTDQAIWTRDKSDITDDEYQAFYQSMSGETENATSWTHFQAEGNINFNSILYLPDKMPDSYRFGTIDQIKGAMRLYVRKVLISDEFDLMPRYLGFIKGVVDSDDLPLNVNRELLQESKILQVIKKKLVRKSIDLIRGLAKEAEDAEKTDEDEDEEDKEDEDDQEEETKDDKKNKYIEWYNKFSNNLKLGVIDDLGNRQKLVKLLRYESNKSGGKMISLEQYVKNSKEWQDQIYVLGGTSVDELKKSPFLGPFEEKDLEVIFMTDPVDEYVMREVSDFDDKKIKQISSDNVKFKDEDEDLVKRREKAYRKKFKPLTSWLNKLYGSAVMRIQISKRNLGKVPAIVTSSEMGHSANMERIMKAQAVQRGMEAPQLSFRVLEINPRHPIVLKLLEGAPPEKEDDDEDAEPFKLAPETKDSAFMLLDMALLNGGFPVNDINAHNKRLTKVLKSQFGLESLDLEPEIDPPVEEDEPPEAGGDGMGGLNMEDFNMDGINLDDLDLDSLKAGAGGDGDDAGDDEEVDLDDGAGDEL